MSKADMWNWITTWIITAIFVRKFLCCSDSLNYLSSILILKLSPVVNAVILVNQTKEIWKDFTRFAIISKPNIQITQNKNPVEANYIAYHTIVNFFKTDIQLSQKKKCSFNDALLLTHAVFFLWVMGQCDTSFAFNTKSNQTVSNFVSHHHKSQQKRIQ